MPRERDLRHAFSHRLARIALLPFALLFCSCSLVLNIMPGRVGSLMLLNSDGSLSLKANQPRPEFLVTGASNTSDFTLHLASGCNDSSMAFEQSGESVNQLKVKLTRALTSIGVYDFYLKNESSGECSNEPVVYDFNDLGSNLLALSVSTATHAHEAGHQPSILVTASNSEPLNGGDIVEIFQDNACTSSLTSKTAST
jgi:hypothetical protein